MICHCKHKQRLPDKTDWKFTLPTGWTAEQAWAIIEILDIISSDIWDIYEDRLLDHVRRKRQKTYDETAAGICRSKAAAKAVKPENSSRFDEHCGSKRSQNGKTETGPSYDYDRKGNSDMPF